MDLAERVAIVTGSGGGIGRAVALALAAHGVRVVGASLAGDGLDETAARIEASGGTALAIPTDVADPDAVDALVERVQSTYGRIDVLVNNAGVLRAIGAVWEVDPDRWWADVAVNLRGPFLCCRSVLPIMFAQGTGTIVNLAGGGYDRPNPGAAGYAAAKAGLMRLTDTLAVELRAWPGVLVYGLWPGFVRSGMTELLARDDNGRRWLPHVASGLAAGEDHPAAEVGEMVVHLVQAGCAELSGRIISFDDDMTMLQASASEISVNDRRQLRLRP